MDLGTVIGLVLGFVLIVVSIVLDGEIGSFINIPGLVIVAGGTVAATLVAENLSNVVTSFKIAMKTFFVKPVPLADTIKTLAELAVVVRKEGLLALENQTIEDPYLAKGVRLAVDGIPPEEIKATLKAELASLKDRHARGKKLFGFMCATAPSMGMVGTLIGLVNMLKNMSDPSAIGPAMAVALLTTFYGAVFAFVIFGPFSEKLGMRSKEETANMCVILEGLDSVLKGENARIVQEKLEGFLPPAERSSEED